MKSIKKIAALLGVLLLSAGVLTGCFGTGLAEGYDQKTILEQSETLINDAVVNGLDKALENRLREDHREAYPMDDMKKELTSLLAGKGNFMAFSQESVIGKHSPDSDEEYAVALITATYERGEIIYTLTFDRDMNVISFFCK